MLKGPRRRDESGSAAKQAASTARRQSGSTRLIRAPEVAAHRPIPLTIRRAGSSPGTRAAEQPAALDSAQAMDVDAIREAARLEAYDEGFEEGLAAGRASAEQQMAADLARLGKIVASVQREHAGFYRAAERQVVELALQLAQKIVEREVENVPDLAVGVVRSALEEMDGGTAVRVRVNPEDYELLRRRWAAALPPTVDADRVELAADPQVQAGGAVIETTQGQVDAQLETKLAQLGNALWTLSAQAGLELTDEPGAAA